MLNKTQRAPLTRALATKNYTVARHNLLLVIILSAVNIVLYLAGSDTMMLFSATVPYYSVVFGWLYSDAFGIPAYLVIGLCAAFVILALYFVCWLLSKKNGGWMIAALVLFALDTVALIALYIIASDVSGILDALIHAWVLYYLIMGVYYGNKLKTLPEDPVPAEETPVEEVPVEEVPVEEVPAEESATTDEEITD